MADHLGLGAADFRFVGTSDAAAEEIPAEMKEVRLLVASFRRPEQQAVVGLMVGSWIWELKRLMQRRQKDKSEEYSRRAMELMADAQRAKSEDALDQTRSSLLELLAPAVRDLNAAKLSESRFSRSGRFYKLRAMWCGSIAPVW